jgi:hypothetical protein
MTDADERIGKKSNAVLCVKGLQERDMDSGRQSGRGVQGAARCEEKVSKSCAHACDSPSQRHKTSSSCNDEAQFEHLGRVRLRLRIQKRERNLAGQEQKGAKASREGEGYGCGAKQPNEQDPTVALKMAHTN